MEQKTRVFDVHEFHLCSVCVCGGGGGGMTSGIGPLGALRYIAGLGQFAA